MKEKSESEIIREANRLWHRLLKCKPYVKYRSRQPKDVPSTQEVKWPEHMEIAFCRGKSTINHGPIKVDNARSSGQIPTHRP
jgi:hypothetical protein